MNESRRNSFTWIAHLPCWSHFQWCRREIPVSWEPTIWTSFRKAARWVQALLIKFLLMLFKHMRVTQTSFKQITTHSSPRWFSSSRFKRSHRLTSLTERQMLSISHSCIFSRARDGGSVVFLTFPWVCDTESPKPYSCIHQDVRELGCLCNSGRGTSSCFNALICRRSLESRVLWLNPLDYLLLLTTQAKFLHVVLRLTITMFPLTSLHAGGSRGEF